MKKLLVTVAALAAVAGANASTKTFDFSNPLATTEISQTGTLGLFDSTLGTLTGAIITVNGEAVMSFGGTNTAAQEQTAKLTSSVDLLWKTSLSPLSSFLGDVVSLSADSGFQSYATGESKSFGPFDQTKSNVDNLSTILASLQAAGGGNFSVSCNSISGLAVAGGGGNISTTQSTKAACGASIVYTYDAVTPPPPAVPEPASLALVGLALAGVAAARRRKA